ncbi:MAG: hypothetical protein AAF663_06530 [Planctomycetota bacterium]
MILTPPAGHHRTTLHHLDTDTRSAALGLLTTAATIGHALTDRHGGGKNRLCHEAEALLLTGLVMAVVDDSTPDEVELRINPARRVEAWAEVSDFVGTLGMVAMLDIERNRKLPRPVQRQARELRRELDAAAVEGRTLADLAADYGDEVLPGGATKGGDQ